MNLVATDLRDVHLDYAIMDEHSKVHLTNGRTVQGIHDIIWLSSALLFCMERARGE